MSLSTNVADLATRVATEIKAIRTLVNGNAADLTSLNTTAKGNLVAAINELQASIAGASGIDDGTTSSSTSWSSTKTNEEIDAAIAALVDASPGTLNTLNELAAALGDDPNFATTVTNQIAGKANATHTHATSDVTGLDTALAGKAPTSHTHTTSQVTGLDTALAGKAPLSHTHGASDLPSATENAAGIVELASTTEATSGVDTARAVTPAGVKAVADTKAAAVHTHAISDVTGLQSALDAKANSADVGSTTTNFVTTFEAGLV